MSEEKAMEYDIGKIVSDRGKDLHIHNESVTTLYLGKDKILRAQNKDIKTYVVEVANGKVEAYHTLAAEITGSKSQMVTALMMRPSDPDLSETWVVKHRTTGILGGVIYDCDGERTFLDEATSRGVYDTLAGIIGKHYDMTIAKEEAEDAKALAKARAAKQATIISALNSVKKASEGAEWPELEIEDEQTVAEKAAEALKFMDSEPKE